jgi:2-methylcitrate dehydratase PrpD
VLEGEYGYFNAFSPEPQLDKVLPGLGEQWLLSTLRIKAYACHATGQAIVAALQRRRRERGIDPAAITSIIVRGNPHWSAASRFWEREPTSLMGAQYSLPYTIAVALVRDLDDPLQFDESVLTDTQVRSLALRMSSEPIEGEHHTEYSELVITDGDGEHVVPCGPYRGSLQDPAQMDDVVAKFERFTSHLLQPAQQQHIVDLVTHIDEVENVGELTRMIRGETK